MKRALLTLVVLAVTAQPADARPPNIVLVFTDDQGYGDLGSFGSDQVLTPTLDRLADEGARLTSFYVAAPTCTPSRAALMTGSYPKRVSLATGSRFVVLLSGDSKGLHPDEVTIAEVLKTRGYATGIFGKWHLGDQPEFLPTRQGFDEFFGIPYSHDIHPIHPDQARFRFPPLPLLDGETVIELDPDASLLTKRITQRAVKFIDEHHDTPFFLYVPHPMPHQPLYVSAEFAKDVPAAVRRRLEAEDGSVDYRTRDALYSAAIAELDWSVAEILRAVKRHGLERDTLVFFTSDNGPTVGSAGPFRGGKGSTFEGGMRVPAIAWWPGRIAAGTVVDELVTAMDLLPTVATLAGAEAPTDRVIDGVDVTDVLLRGAKSPRERLYYYRRNQLMAVRSGPWKYHWRLHGDRSGRSTALFHLPTDAGEQRDVSAEHPEIVERLTNELREFESELGAGDALSPSCRPAGTASDPRPLSR